MFQLTVQANTDPIIPNKPKETKWLIRELEEGGFTDIGLMKNLEMILHEITRAVYDEYMKKVEGITYPLEK